MIKSSTIMFHGFHSEKHISTPGSISQENLRQMLQAIISQRKIIGPEEFFYLVERGDYLKDLQGKCLLTFDDGLNSQYQVAVPVLQEFGIRAVFNIYTSVFDSKKPTLEIFSQFRSKYFTNFSEFYEAFLNQLETMGKKPLALLSGFSDSYLSESPFYSQEERKFRFMRDQSLGPTEYEETMNAMIQGKDTTSEALADSIWMRETDLVSLVQAGHHVGLHSHTHPIRMSELPPEAQVDEFKTNFERLSEITQTSPLSVAYPCGNYSSETMTILQRLGIRYGFRAFPSSGELIPSMEIPRDDHAEVARSMGII